MPLRRIAAVPLIGLGGVVVVLSALLSIYFGLYYLWQAVKLLWQGELLLGLVLVPIISVIVSIVLGIIHSVGSALLAFGGWLWDTRE